MKLGVVYIWEVKPFSSFQKSGAGGGRQANNFFVLFCVLPYMYVTGKLHNQYFNIFLLNFGKKFTSI